MQILLFNTISAEFIFDEKYFDCFLAS